ncbi:MAG: putative secretion system protein GspG-like 2 [Proteobacteria bacterium]|nr:putative secretion system protein GspG-like 2 [Pseudomonadota bacterium]
MEFMKPLAKKYDSARPAWGRGFTLIEMLVVLTLVALLMTLALPRYFGSLERSKETALQENLKVLRVTIDKFYADHARYPETLEELVERKYLRSVPFDPVTETERTWITIPVQDADKKGIADVKSGARGKDSYGRAYETY